MILARPSFLLLIAGLAWSGEVPLGHREFRPTPQQPVGWRGDGSGSFPGAQPVANLDPKGTHVRWRTETPAWGNASPIVVGKLVVITAEPDLVLAYDVTSGKEVWRADSAWTEGMPVDKGAAAQVALVTTIDATGKEAEKAGESALKAFGIRPPFDFHSFGFSLATPASDGERIYVKCATGTVCAYDLAGKRLWRHADPRLNNAPLCHSSPLVIDGKVVVLHPDGNKGTLAVTALDAVTGKPAWTTPGVADAGYRAAASPVALRVGGAALILVPAGDILRVADGRRLADQVQNCILGATPLVRGDVIYGTWNNPEKKGMTGASRLVPGKDGFTVTPLFAVEREGFVIASPLLAGDTLLLLGNNGPRAYDANNGAVIALPGKLKMTGNGHAFWPSPVVSGTSLVLCLNGGEIMLIDGIRTWKTLSSATLEAMSASPWLQGSRVYIRTSKALWCFGSE